MSAKTRNMRQGTVIIQDGSATPKTLVIKISQGDFKWDVKHNASVVMNRGRIDHRTKGDEAPMSLSFSLLMEQWSYDQANTGMSPIDALTGSAVAIANGWVSSDGCGDAWSVTVLFQLTDPCDPTHYEQLKFPDFHADDLGGSENNTANIISVKGTSLAQDPIRTWV